MTRTVADDFRDWIVDEVERQRPMLEAAKGLLGVKVQAFRNSDGSLQDVRIEPLTVHKQRRT